MHREVIRIPVDGVVLEGELVIPLQPNSLVIFSQVSNRFDLRNSFVADHLHKEGIATVLIQLRANNEEANHELGFDIEMLTSRLMEVTKFLVCFPSLSSLPIAYFSTGSAAASALCTVASFPDKVHAVVCLEGRPDLAFEILHRVEAAVLLMVGDRDEEMKEINNKAFKELICIKSFLVVQGASYLFEEPGSLEKVIMLSKSWFKAYSIEGKSSPKYILSL